MKRLALVTGGAGFIGSHLVERLLGQGYAVRVLDDLSSGREQNLAAAAGAAELLRGDCRDPAAAAAAVRGADVVFHEAALPSVARSVEDPVGSNRINLDGTLQLLEAARSAGVRRFVFAGSSAAYGNGPESPKRETLPPEPLSPYAAQKVAGEHYCRVFAECYGLHTVVLRYFNVYGPRQDPSSPYSGVISLFMTALLAGNAPRIYGDGGQTRDFVEVGDVALANQLAAERDVPPGTVVNVASGRTTSILELFQGVRAAVGGTAEQVEPRFLPARAGDVRHSLADIGRARALLGFAPAVALADGLARTVAYYRKELLP